MTVDRPAVRAYIGQGNESRTDAQIDSALAAERGHQRRRCRFPDVLDVSQEAVDARAVLDEALCRRVVVNLARRALPLGMQMTDVGAARLSGSDPEVRRLEGPYRKVVVG